MLKSPLLLNSFSAPVNRLAGPLNSCLVLKRKFTSLQDNALSAAADIKAGFPLCLYELQECHNAGEVRLPTLPALHH